MKITWLGHSAFELFSHGVKILIDPFFTGNPLCGDTKDFVNPDLILVTHDHGDHLGDTVSIMKNGKTQFLAIADLCYYLPSLGVNKEQIMFGGNGMSIGGTVKFGDFSITMTPAFHSTGHGSCAGFIVKDPDGFTVYHAGDTALFGDMALLAERHAIDVALLPIGGHFTMDGLDAAKACSYLEAKHVIPMHYKTFPMLCQDTKEFSQYLTQYSSETKLIPINPNESIEL
jgi:L-ascorbate metabolism protein UlaG (beta-lactamase superfamily)